MGNPKIQAPNKFQVLIKKQESPQGRLQGLEFEICLGFGYWNLELPR